MIKFRKLLLYLFCLILSGLFWWVLFLFNTFPKQYYLRDFSYNDESTGIVVLTGGKGRIEKGLELIRNTNADKMFITGVVSLLNIEKKYGFKTFNSDLYNCCIFFDNRATNTHENIVETSKWLSSNLNIKNVILVSSYYHLPRSLIIFNNFLPNVSIQVVAAEENLKISEDLFFHLKLITFEYFKTLYSAFYYL